MTWPLFLVERGALDRVSSGAEFVLDGPEGRHAATVRRIGAEERVQLADGAGTLAVGEVTAAQTDRLVIRIDQIGDVPAQAPRMVLLQALAKGGRDEQAIEAATELGVDAVVPWQAQRSIVQWRGDKQARALGKWEAAVRAAAKQSRRPTVPAVEAPITFRTLASRLDGRCAVVLHEEAEMRLADVPLDGADEIVLVVGPEGGITPDELDVCRSAGAHVVRLGPHVLRSSTAGPAALAALLSRTRW